MLSFLNKPYPFNNDLKHNLWVVFGLGLGMFLFMLFFQPVNLTEASFNTRLLLTTGYGGIVSAILIVGRIIIPSLFHRLFQPENWKLGWDILLHFSTWASITVAFDFYTIYVAGVSLEWFLAFKLILIALLPDVVIVVSNENQRIKIMLASFVSKGETIERAANQNRPDHQEKHQVLLESDNKAERLLLPLHELLAITSADNYIEVFWFNEGKLNRELIRNTLSNTEEMLHSFPGMIRCHRTFIINAAHIATLSIEPRGITLMLNGFPDPVPVSRQYLYKIKEYIKK